MRAVVQRVSEASVRVDGRLLGSIKHGYMVLLDMKAGNSTKDASVDRKSVV